MNPVVALATLRKIRKPVQNHIRRVPQTPDASARYIKAPIRSKMDADSALAWVRAEIAPLAVNLQPAFPDANSTWALCEFLRDGRALCLLTSALDNVKTAAKEPEDNNHEAALTLPKNLQRSLHQVSTFHALERIQYFIKWCRSVPLDAYLVFSSVQLLDELNEKVICVCLDALRNKFRPELRGKSSDLLVQKSMVTSEIHADPPASAADTLPVGGDVAEPAVVSEADGKDDSDNEQDNNAQEEHALPPPVDISRLSSAPPASQSKSNKLNAFLSKFPSETNVLTAAVTVEAAVEDVVADKVAEVVDEEEVDEEEVDEEEVHEYVHDEIHDNVHENVIEEVVHKEVDVQEDVDVQDHEEVHGKPNEESDDEDFEEPSFEQTPHEHTHTRYAGAFSPRSSFSSSKRSSVVSSLSFSFTSDPRGKESFSEELTTGQSFSSVVSSPPASPRAATRLRIPSIFEKNSEKKSESNTSGGASTDRSSSSSSVTSSTKEEPRSNASPAVSEGPTTAPKVVSRLEIPNVFSQARANGEATSTTTAPATSPAVEASPVQKPRPVSRLQIPSAFASSSSASTTPAPAVPVAVGSSIVDDAVSSTADSSSVPDASPKPVSKLNIPAAFARSTSSSSTVSIERSPVVKRVSQESSSSAATPELKKKPSRLKIPSVFGASAVTDAPPSPKRSEPETHTVAATTLEAALPVTPATIEAALATIESASGEAAFEAAPPVNDVASPVVESAPASFEAAPPSISRSTSSSSTKPSSKLAAFLSTVEVANAFVITPSEEPKEQAAKGVDAEEQKREDGAFEGQISGAAALVEAVAKQLTQEEQLSCEVAPEVQIQEPVVEDLPAEPRFSETQETMIGLPCDSQEPVVAEVLVPEEAVADKQAVEARFSEASDHSDDSDDQVSREQFSDERLSDELFPEQVPEQSMTEELTVQVAASVEESPEETAVGDVDEAALGSEELLGDYVEVEQHNFDNHDHADGEQPFFVVEEVSLSKPPTNSKLFAFLSSVDSAHPHPSSHASEEDKPVEADEAEVERASSVSSRHSSPRKSAGSRQKKSVEGSTASDHSDRSARTSVTAISLAVSSEVILEKERLSGENLALTLKLKAVEDSLRVKEDDFAAVKAELEALKNQFAAAHANSEAKLKAAAEEKERLLAETRATHLEQIAAAHTAHDHAIREKKLVEEQLQLITSQSQTREAKLSALAEQNQELEQQVQFAKDSEEAARYSAQVAFAARDEAEELIRSQQEKIEELTQRLG